MTSSGRFVAYRTCTFFLSLVFLSTSSFSTTTNVNSKDSLPDRMVHLETAPRSPAMYSASAFLTAAVRVAPMTKCSLRLANAFMTPTVKKPRSSMVSTDLIRRRARSSSSFETMSALDLLATTRVAAVQYG